jgi:Sulfotransferase domain
MSADRLPNFFLVGAAKAGTSSLHAYLDQHPQIFMSTPKEPSFFALEGSTGPVFRRPDGSVVPVRVVRDLDSYRALFRDAGGARIVGDASTIYLFDEKTPHRLRQRAPDARIVAVLRQPVDRAYSHYLYFRFRGHEPLASFTDAFWAEDERVARGLGAVWSYRSKGLYAPQLARYFERFSPEQIRVYLYDDWRADPRGMIADLFRFLGLGDSFVPDMSVRHRAGGIARSPGLRRVMEDERGLVRHLARAMVPPRLRPRVEALVDRWNAVSPPLPPAIRRELTEFYREDIVALEELIDRDLSRWLDDGR